MNEPKLIYIKEPKLSFGHNQEMEDPRDGLTLFGPHSKKEYSGQINIGIIGPREQRGYFKKYINKLQKPIFNNSNDIARPYFPGFEAVFGMHIKQDFIQEIDIDRQEIDNYLNYSDGHLRVFNLTELYAAKLKKFYHEEHAPVGVWFVVIPDEIYTYGKPKSRIPASDKNIKSKLNKYEQTSSTIMLFDSMNQLQEAYNYEINFHNQLKAKVLNNKIVTQIILESTIAYESIWNDAEKINSEKIFDTAKAWNISTTLYYKAGGIPWKLAKVRENVCYLGLVFKKIDFDNSDKNACCAAQMFLDSGDGMVFRGNPGNYYNPVSKEFHLTKDDAKDLLSRALQSFTQKLGKESYPKEVFIHAKTYFDENEWQGFVEAAEGKSKIIGVRIRNDGSFKMYRDFSYCVPRGTALIINDTFAYLMSKGYIPRLQTQLGLEVPNPISVEIIRGQGQIEQVCEDVLALTKLNYNTCMFAEGSPVTLRFADSIGEVLTAGKDIQSAMLQFKHYI